MPPYSWSKNEPSKQTYKQQVPICSLDLILDAEDGVETGWSQGNALDVYSRGA